MELRVLEYTGKKLKFQILGEDHTFANILRKELWQDKNTKLAGYNLEHSLITAPNFVLETDGKDAKDVMEKAIQRLKKLNENLLTNLKKLF
ncbi:DNA-directed RNA polymerase subunit L [Candidatus Woesearchaeota archaeon]|nr:DNA-directed RNA polymerase subunit L [Candidatus Woesearchaeota archaeon]